MYPQWLSSIDSEAIIITSNSYLAQYLKTTYLKIHQDKLKVSSLGAQSINTWLHSLWQEWLYKNLVILKPNKGKIPLPAEYILLNSPQRFYIWKNLASNNTCNSNNILFNGDDTINKLIQTWQVIQQYNISPHRNNFTYHTDSEFYYAIMQKWRQECINKKYIDLDSLANTLIHAVKNSLVNIPLHICLVGFYKIYPQLQTLLDHFQELGTKISIIDVFTPSSTNIKTLKPASINHVSINHASINHDSSSSIPYKVACSSIHEELSRSVNWANKINHKNHQAVIGIIAPHTVHAQLLKMLAKLMPAHCFFSTQGEELVENNIITSAINILSLREQIQQLEVISKLLLCPYTFDPTSIKQRVFIDIYIRRQNISQISLSEILKLPIDTSSISRYVNNIIDFLQINPPKSALASDWAKIFMQQLAILGWPASEKLTENENKLIESFYKVIDQLASLDAVSTDMTHEEALYWLNYLMQKVRLDSSTISASIGIYSIEEAVAINFDYLWITQLTMLNFPASVNNSPFIPYYKLINAKVARMSKEDEYDFSLSLLNTLQKHTRTQFITSYVIENGESILISQFNNLICTNFDTNNTHTQCEILDDNYGPAINAQISIKQGLQFLNNQIACPFKGFVTHRLHATYLPATVNKLGLSKAERGQVIHQILAKFWQQVKNSTNYTNLSAEQITKIVLQITQKYLPQHMPSIEKKQIKHLETEYLTQLITAWLKYEINSRISKFSVVEIEKKYPITLNNKLKFYLRIDRLDKLDTGESVIVDYKTGKVIANDWQGERANNMQLALYSQFESNLLAVVYAVIDIKEMTFRGWNANRLTNLHKEGSNNYDFKKEEKNSNFIDESRLAVNTIAQEICSGYAKVKPKNTQTCQYCHLQAVCRIKSLPNT